MDKKTPSRQHAPNKPARKSAPSKTPAGKAPAPKAKASKGKAARGARLLGNQQAPRLRRPPKRACLSRTGATASG